MYLCSAIVISQLRGDTFIFFVNVVWFIAISKRKFLADVLFLFFLSVRCDQIELSRFLTNADAL